MEERLPWFDFPNHERTHVFFYRSFNSVGKRSLPSLAGRFTSHPSLDIIVHPLDAAARNTVIMYICPFQLLQTSVNIGSLFIAPGCSAERLYLAAVSSEN